MSEEAKQPKWFVYCHYREPSGQEEHTYSVFDSKAEAEEFLTDPGKVEPWFVEVIHGTRRVFNRITKKITE